MMASEHVLALVDTKEWYRFDIKPNGSEEDLLALLERHFAQAMAAAERRGAERMRAACAALTRGHGQEPGDDDPPVGLGHDIAAAIDALPLPGDES